MSNNGTSDVDYAAGIARHQATAGTGAFRNGASYATSYADFDQSYDPINGLNYEATASRYSVQTGDTLESIAQSLWGDASFWYMIADANGLSGAGTLVAGQSLVIPNKVHNSHNNSATWKVYDPNEAIGDTAPNAAKAANKKNGCGVVGQILLVAIAIAVSAVTYGALTSATTTVLGGIAAGAAAGAAGSVASQGFGLATGLQDKFSFKGVALAALGGAVGGGLKELGRLSALGKIGGTLGKAGKFLGGSGVLSGVARGVVTSGLTQGLGVATGLQEQFSWAGVAAAGVGGGVGNWVGGGSIVSGMAGGLAGAAAESLVSGKDFGDTLMANLPSIIGNTIGNLVGDAVVGGGAKKSAGGTSGEKGSDGTAQGVSKGSAVDDAPQPGDLVVTASRHASFPLMGVSKAIYNQDVDDLAFMPISSIIQRSAILSPNNLRSRASAVTAGDNELIKMPGMDVVLFGPGVDLLPVPIASLEGFDAGAKLASRIFDLDAVITGPQFDPFLGSGGLHGQAVIDGRVYGNSAPDLYYFGTVTGSDGASRLTFGKGDPSLTGVNVGFGGGVPLLINGQAVSGYNKAWNRYNESSGTGKNIVAYNSSLNISAVFVQPHGDNGHSLGAIRNYIKNSGYDYALMFDGSGSASLNYQGRQIISPEIIRQPLIPLGIGFKSP